MNRDRWILLLAWPIIVTAHVSIGVANSWQEIREAWRSFGRKDSNP